MSSEFRGQLRYVVTDVDVQEVIDAYHSPDHVTFKATGSGVTKIRAGQYQIGDKKKLNLTVNRINPVSGDKETVKITIYDGPPDIGKGSGKVRIAGNFFSIPSSGRRYGLWGNVTGIFVRYRGRAATTQP